jgi:hypothetical protein
MAQGDEVQINSSELMKPRMVMKLGLQQQKMHLKRHTVLAGPVVPQ